jgi:hypothetical protein
MFEIPAVGSDEDLRAEYRQGQVLARREVGIRLLTEAIQRLENADIQGGERAARQALASLRASLDWAEDSELEDGAHRRLDAAGMWVRRTFGCLLERRGQEYKQTCPVALGHNRIGLSVGGIAYRTCSLCGQDVSECEHLPGTAYLVPGGAEQLGWCRVCLKTECDHLPVERYRASVVAIITEMELEEVSIVPKPAHPEARIHAVGVSVSELRAALGPGFRPGMDISCDRCLSRCGGLIRHGASNRIET